MSDIRWLLLLCAGRVGFGMINTVYSGLIPALRLQWDMSAAEAGLVQSAWHGGYIVSLVAASQLAGRFGARRTFLGMGGAALATTLLFALGAHDFRSAFLLYGLAGLCAGGSYVPGLTLIAERFAPAVRGRAMGAYIAAASLGYAIGLAGGSGLATALTGAAGARAAFLLAAAGTLGGLLLAAYTLRATPNVITPHPHRGVRAALGSLRWLWCNRPARFVILAYAFHAWELLGLWAWLPAFLSAAAAHAGDSALPLVGAGASLAALTHLVSTAGSLVGGRWSDRLGRERVILWLSLASVVCSLAFGWLLAAPLWLVVLVAVVFNFAAVGDSAIFSASLTEVVPAQHLAAAYSARSVLGFGMGAASPWLFGVVLDAAAGTALPGWGAAWAVLGVVAAVGPWLTWRSTRPTAQTLKVQMP